MEDKDIIFRDESSINEFYMEENCHILEIYNMTEDESFSLAKARVEVGETTKWHEVKETVECYYILRGKGKVELGTAYTKLMNPGSFVRIPVGMRQRIENIGTIDLEFLCICLPAFRQHNYLSLD